MRSPKSVLTRHLRLAVAGLAIALAIRPDVVTAQVGTPTTVSDSLVSFGFLPKVIKALADDFAIAARDTARRTVWQITLPEDNREAWIPLRDFVLRATNGRLATAADSNVETLTIHGFVMQKETLELNLKVGVFWRCPSGGSGGSGTMYAVRMPPQEFGPRYRRVSDPVETGHYDSIGCGVGGVR